MKFTLVFNKIMIYMHFFNFGFKCSKFHQIEKCSKWDKTFMSSNVINFLEKTYNLYVNMSNWSWFCAATDKAVKNSKHKQNIRVIIQRKIHTQAKCQFPLQKMIVNEHPRISANSVSSFLELTYLQTTMQKESTDICGQN